MTSAVFLLSTAMIGAAGWPSSWAREEAHRAQPPAALQEASRALAAGDPDAALRLAGTHLDADPESVAARILMARAHAERGDLHEAYEQLRRALQSSPADVDVLYYLGIVAGRLAEAELHRLARVAPDSARLHQVKAESLLLQGQPHEAAAAYEAALARGPNLVDALLGLAKLRRTSLRCREAIELYERAERLRPTFEAAYGLGVCHQYEAEDRIAAGHFERATRRDPREALAWQGLGLSEMKLGRLDRAIAHLQRAVEIRPDMHEAHYALGQAYRTAGDLDKAKAAFAAAQRLQQRSQERRAAPPEPAR